MFPLRNKAAVVGVGWSKVSRHADVTLGALTVDALKQAVEDAGLTMDQVDGLSNYPNPSRPGAGSVQGVDLVGVNYVARVLGMKQLRWHAEITQGTVTSALSNASTAVPAGACNYALVWRGMFNPPGHHNVAAAPRAGGDSQFSLPYGLGGPGVYGMPYSRYMAKYGARREHMATHIVNNRKNASMNPHSVFYGEPISKEDYMDARMIADPMSILDCDMYVDGCAAVVVTTADRARDLRQKPAYIAGFAQSMRYSSSPIVELDAVRVSERRLAKNLWEPSGYQPQDIDQANVYDGFSPFVYFWLENLGFCGEGEAFEFIQNGRIELGGELPLNTAGGNLGVGRMHGMPHVSEAVQQIQGRCGPRQVKDAEVTIAVVGAPDMAGGLVFCKNP